MELNDPTSAAAAASRGSAWTIRAWVAASARTARDFPASETVAVTRQRSLLLALLPRQQLGGVKVEKTYAVRVYICA